METQLESRGGRLAWADIAKGICIFLVVLYHVTIKSYDEVDWTGSSLVREVWDGLSTALLPLRMPLFFVISGYFSVRALARPWGQVLEPRVYRLYYLYVVWLTIQTLFFTFGPPLDTYLSYSPASFARNLIIGTTASWYLYALVVYFVLAKLVRPINLYIPISLAAMLNVAIAANWINIPDNGEAVVRNLLFFLIGAYLPGIVNRAVDMASIRNVLTVGSIYAGGIVIIYAAGIEVAKYWIVGLNLVAIWLGIMASVVAATIFPLRTAGRYLGSRTLPIYVMHLPLLAVLNLGVRQIDTSPLFTNVYVSAVYPLVVSVSLTGLCIILHGLLLSHGAGWLFQLPRILAEILGRIGPSHRQPVHNAAVEGSMHLETADAVSSPQATSASTF